ncbi:MAG: phosphoribosylanthranilate isomerase [Alphaproteobacteria bacterium]|nr:phosphoribosylanthranilate isomerase [Alphaproteobacteria bacterium]
MATKRNSHNNINVKICGIRDAEIIAHLIKHDVAYAGLVFYQKSPRYITPIDAKKLTDTFSGNIKFVGLFVDETIDTIIDIHKIVGFDMIQLHGHETPQMIQSLKAKISLPIIKAVGIAQMSDIIDAQKYWQIADIMLFDAKPQADDELTGGLGRGFDHQLINEAKILPNSWWLAGGLNDKNICEILQKLDDKPAVIDLSSSLESVIGVKSPEKITALMEALKNIKIIAE